MSLQFTSDARPPSNVTLLPNGFIRPAFGELYGFDADADSPDAPSYSNTYSVEFDGSDDYMDTGNTFLSTFQSGFSISLWVKMDSGGSGTQMIFATYGTDASTERLVLFSSSLSSVNLFMTANGVGTSTISGSATFTNWSHVVATFEQSGSSVIKTLYVNGSQASTATKAGMTLADYGASGKATSPYLGARNRNNNPSLYGNEKIDEVAIIPSVLSSSDVTAIYNSGVPADLTSYSPVGYWRMGDNDGGTGTTITDQGSGGNDGTLVNGPTFSTDIPS